VEIDPEGAMSEQNGIEIAQDAIADQGIADKVTVLGEYHPRGTTGAVDVGGMVGGVSVPAPDLVWTKLRPPTPRAGLIPRDSLQTLLQAGLQSKLCLVGAPGGSGKTTLLKQFAAAGGRVAWVSLDEGDNDPIRLWTYVVEALRTVEPSLGTAALPALRGASPDLQQTVLPGLINELSMTDGPLVLVLDDYHLVTDPGCHQSLAFFLDHLPADVHLVLSTRADPPFPLARMRARGELGEIRIGELEFTGEEAAALLNGSMGLRLATDEVTRLAERTEGWAAGLVLAGMSLRGREDARGFIASFRGDNRNVADFLGTEVLARQPEPIRAFLLRTSVLERLSGPLCDAVLATQGSAELLADLERSNLFLVPLDDRREWYRYHHLFAELLRAELADRDPELLPTLHRRAAAWHRRSGNHDEAIHHASAAGDFAEAAASIGRHWLTLWRRGQRATVARWLDLLPDETIMAMPQAAWVAAWIRGSSGASKEATDGWLAAAEGDGDEGNEEPLPDGVPSLGFGVNIARAMLLFDDVGRSVEAACLALELAEPEPSPSFWMAQSALGQARYMSGEPVVEQPRLEELVRRVSAAEQPFAVVLALAVLSLVAGEGEDDGAAALARRAVATAEAHGLSASPLCAIAYLAVGRALTRQGELAEAEEHLERALERLEIDSMLVVRAFAMLLLASARRGRGDIPGARGMVEQASELIERSVDAGSLPALLIQAQRQLASPPRRRVELATPLTERELVILRLLPTQLSAREIGRELYISVTTVRSHVQAIYRKLGVATRAEAVACARQRGLLPGTSPSRGNPTSDEPVDR
jgi:LuxR family transcriptional regulator, maltose regulon positive regulatory protein